VFPKLSSLRRRGTHLVPAEIYLTVAVRVCELNAKNRAAEAIGVAEVVSVRLSVNTACPTVFAASAPFVKAAFVTTTVHLVAFERSRYHTYVMLDQ